ncbi:uncharacterized protein LOC122961294 [Acropora millepora]|uniref:uncharacterized protein LOC122961294 n=1 Tax=Acropora millepora TaxID=45264 RepID=UPI001CF2024E|nr:uncharacterized protein LOC122961294 [Acropora millepora]
MLRGFVMMTLNKLPHVKPDLVHTDDNWESWDMEAFIDGLKKWLKRHNTEERPGDSYKPPLDPFRPPRDRNKDEKHWFINDDAGKDQVDSQRNKGTPWGNFISSEAVNQLKLNPTHHETRQMVTLNGTKTTIHANFSHRHGFLRRKNEREDRSYWKQDAGIRDCEKARHE